VRRRPVFLLPLVLLLGAGPALPQEEAGTAPIEEFLPADTALFLSLPDGAKAARVLERAGEDFGALAGRLASRAKAERTAVAETLAALLDAADGPVTFSVHVPLIPGLKPRPEILVTAAARKSGAKLKAAADAFVEKVVGRIVAKKASRDLVMEVPTLHLTGGTSEVYSTYVRGHALVSTSAFVLGRVIREMQTGKSRTLRYSSGFVRARAAVGAGDGDGFLWVGDETVLPFGNALGIRWAAGVLGRDGKGVVDRLLLAPRPGGLLDHLQADNDVPAGWDGAGFGLWIGAALDADGAQAAAMASLPRTLAVRAMRLGKVAAGPLEVATAEDGSLLLRVLLKDGADAGTAGRALRPHAALGDGDLVVAEDPEAAPGLPERTAARWDGGGVAALRATVPALLRALGRTGAPGKRKTVWTAELTSGGVLVSSGRAELGPVAATAASLFR